MWFFCAHCLLPTLDGANRWEIRGATGAPAGAWETAIHLCVRCRPWALAQRAPMPPTGMDDRINNREALCKSAPPR